jgi:serine protease DegS
MAASQQRVRSESAAPVAAVADTSAAYALSAAFRSAADRALPAVVFVSVEREARMVRGRTPQQQQPMPELPEQFRRFFELPGGQDLQTPPEEGAGSGFIIDPQGQIVTNHHVVADADRIEVRLHDGREFEAKLIASDPNTDVALIQINAPRERLPSIGFGDAQRLHVGDWVLALGNPLGFDFTVTAGIVSAKGRGRFTGNQMALESFIQTDAAINPGNSGGALINAHGQLVGINTAIFSKSGGSQGIGFAIPVTLAKGVMEQILRQGRVVRGWLGIAGQDITQELAESFDLKAGRGVLVSGVLEGGPADQAGLTPGDVISTINEQPLTSSHDILNLIAAVPPGEKVRVKGWRNGEPIDIQVEVSERPRLDPQQQ